jgi:hypothetical protein
MMSAVMNVIINMSYPQDLVQCLEVHHEKNIS